MNPVVVILISVLTVSAGLLVYDTVREDPQPRLAAPEVYTPVLDGDEDGELEPEPYLEGYGIEALSARVDKLAREYQALKQALEAAGAKVGEDGMLSAGPSRPGDGLELPVVDEGADGDSVDFDEQFLRSFRTALERVEADRREERVVSGLDRQLDRLGVQLDESQRESVIQSTMNFREKTRSLWQELPRGSDEESRERRRSAFETLREEYSTTIYSLVPTAEAEKIVDGMGRGIGFSSRRRGRDR